MNRNKQHNWHDSYLKLWCSNIIELRSRQSTDDAGKTKIHFTFKNRGKTSNRAGSAMVRDAKKKKGKKENVSQTIIFIILFFRQRFE